MYQIKQIVPYLFSILLATFLLESCQSEETKTKTEYVAPPLEKRILGTWQLNEVTIDPTSSPQKQPQSKPIFMVIKEDVNWIMLDKDGISIKGTYELKGDTLHLYAEKARSATEILLQMVVRPTFLPEKDQMFLTGRLSTKQGPLYYEGAFNASSKEEYEAMLERMK